MSSGKLFFSQRQLNRYGFSRCGADGKNRIGLSVGLEAGVFDKF